MDLNQLLYTKNIFTFFFRILAVLFRVLFIIFLPQWLELENFNLFILFSNLIMYSATISGLGFPVYFIKKFSLGEIRSSFYLKYVVPISILSGLVFFLGSLFLFPRNLGFSWSLILMIILIGEIITIEYLRLYQAKSILKKHVIISLIKSFTTLSLFLFLNYFFKNLNLFILLLSWSISNLAAILYIKPNLIRIFNFKIPEKIFTKTVVTFSIFYFFGYLIDRSVLYYDKLFFFQYIDQGSLKKLNILILIFQTSFNLIESTFLLSVYHKVFNKKFHLKLNSKFKYFLYIIFYSIFIASFLVFFYDDFILNDFIKLILLTSFFYIFSISSWFENIQNYSSLSSVKYFIISTSVAIIYIFTVFVLLSFKVSFLIFPLLYPVVSTIIQKIFRFKYVYSF